MSLIRVFVFFLLLLLLLLSIQSPIDGFRILLVPGNINSHLLYFSRLGETLAKLGHAVRVVAPSNGKVPRHLARGNLSMTVYDVDGQVPFANSVEMSETLMKMALSDSKLEKFLLLYPFGKRMLAELERDCLHLMDNEKAMREIREGGYQFAIMDPMAINCYYLLPYSLGIPYASLSIPSLTWIFMRVPRLPSFVSSFGNTDVMTFTERVVSFVGDLSYLTFIDSSTALSERFVPDKPPLGMMDLMERSSAWFFMEDLSVGYARPNMPNTASVGDIMAQPAKPLPPEIQRFLDESPDGAAVVSFGSFFDHVPESVAGKFCAAFRRIKRLRIVWKLKNPEFCPDLDDHVVMLPWLPQNDILAHRNVRLFVTHGGFNSVVESVFHGKPMIVFPIALDQPTNAVAAAAKGFAVEMKLSDFTFQELESNIRKILTEPRYLERAAHASAIIKAKRDSPAERVAFLVDHVIQYGDGHLRTGAAQLTPFQFIMFDVFLFLLFVLLVVMTIAIFCLCCAVCACRKCICTRRRKHKTA